MNGSPSPAAFPYQPTLPTDHDQCTMTHSNRRTLASELREDDARLDSLLRQQVGICVETYKAIRFAFRAIGIAIVALAMFRQSIQPNPMTLLILAAFVLGPDVVEAYLTRDS